MLAQLGDPVAPTLDGAEGGHELWALVLEASRLDEIVEQVVRTLEFSVLAKYAFGAGADVQRVLSSRADPQRGARGRPALARRGVAYVRLQLTRALDLMGIAVPARM